LESIYEWCLTRELELRGHKVLNQDKVIIRYKQFQREDPLRFDMLVNQCLFVEVKAVEKVRPIHKARLLSYMKLLDIPLGLVINFNVPKLTDGGFQTDSAGRKPGLRPPRGQSQLRGDSLLALLPPVQTSV